MSVAVPDVTLQDLRMFLYTPGYYLRWLGHVFPVEKYQLTHDRILAEGIARSDEIVEPDAATRAQLERAHSAAYLDELERLAAEGIGPDNRFEAPLTEDILRAALLATGGTIEACRRALAPGGPRGLMNLSGGYHHAYRDHGEGFCFVNDVAVAVAGVLADGMASRVMVVDCDVHQGNGTAATFATDDRVFTLDIHQQQNYPLPKEPASCNIGLPDATGDDRYLELLGSALANHVGRFAPELILYLAGGDPYVHDRLGGLALTKDGFARRDEMVLSAARDAGAALAVVLAGGYPEDIGDVVDIHVRTARMMKTMLGSADGSAA
jgi:acetoin utilization deacetylase AcuC-like enzyme